MGGRGPCEVAVRATACWGSASASRQLLPFSGDGVVLEPDISRGAKFKTLNAVVGLVRLLNDLALELDDLDKQAIRSS